VTAVLLLAKAPRPGRVKTRLAREIGATAALAAYRRVGAGVAAAVGAEFDLTVWHDPPDAEQEMRDWLGDHQYRAQQGGDLGERMSRAFAAHFDRGDRPVLAIGADTPGVGAEVVREAVRALKEADVVLGPALDGGYYLIGLNREAPRLFEGVPWGTPRVLQVTVALCVAHDLTVGRLAPLRDLDTAADLEALGLRRG
jgi:rSAM/selenodomain-associated transferase 1